MKAPVPALSLALLSLLGQYGCTHRGHAGHHGHTSHHRFENAESWAARFDDPARDEWQKPREVIAALALPEQAKVADLGAGTGYFAARLAKALPKATIYAVDIEPDMVRYLGERAAKESLPNLLPVQGAPEDPKLPEAVDLILVVDTYHHLAAREAYFRNLATRLTPKGQVAIIDFRRGQPMGPPDEHKMPAAQVTQEMGDAGYSLVADHPFLPNQHFLVFARP